MIERKRGKERKMEKLDGMRDMKVDEGGGTE
jgi:hypothetical protein